METYFWTCNCGKQGRKLEWGKMVKASLRHLAQHERKLEWDSEQDFQKVGA